MRVYLTPQAGLSRAMDRVVRALVARAPDDVEIVTDPRRCDLRVLHVIGYPETVTEIERCRREGRPYAMIQYCFLSTQEPTAEAWSPLWRTAKVVWSYYDLSHVDPGGPHLMTPLGVDDVFRQADVDFSQTHRNSVISTGFVAESECLREVALAAAAAGLRHVHVGPDLGLHPSTEYRLNISDTELRDLYLQARFVTGLRRGEGFELPLAEGSLCGAAPVMFDSDCYLRWLNRGYWVPEESTPLQVVEYLTDIFRRTPSPDAGADWRLTGLRRFNWDTIAPQFWARVTA